MKRLPWLLIVVMFIEIGLDAMGVMGSLSREHQASLPPNLIRLVLAMIFTLCAFKRQRWAMIAWVILEGLTGFVLAVISGVFFNKPGFRDVAWGCIAITAAIAGITYAFARCAKQWGEVTVI